MLNFTHLHPRAEDLLGFIPWFLSEDDPRSAAEQFNDAYAHGGGWQPFGKDMWTMKGDAIVYPGDPAHHPVAEGRLRDERILVYPYAWVAIVQPDGSFEVARMD